MTTQIETSKGHIMAVKDFHTAKEYNEFMYNLICGALEEYKLVGKWSQLTEEHTAMMVDDYGSRFLNYKTNDIEFSTAIESFNSLMHANGIYLVNPHGEEPKYRIAHDRWQEAEANSGEHLILFKAK